MSKFNNQVVLITGGTSGIGLATAKRYIDAGAKVTVTGSSEGSVAAAKSELAGKATVIRSDIRDPEAIDTLIKTVAGDAGRIDHIFLNAGIALFAPLEEVDADFFNRLFEVNVRGPLLAVKAAVPYLKKGSTVVFNTSVLNEKGWAASSVYSATKAAVRSITRSLAAELTPLGIRVNAVSPGPIETPIFSKLGMDKASLDEFASGVVQQIPLGRFGRADEVANTALFLASPEASFIIGEEIKVDGGLASL